MAKLRHGSNVKALEWLGYMILLAGLGCAVAYEMSLYGSDPATRVLMKGGFCLSLAVFAVMAMQSFDGALVGFGLLTAAAGDMALAVPIDDAFARGLVAFMGTHIIYIVVFWRMRLRAYELTGLRLRLISFLWLFTSIAAYFLYGIMGEEKFLVVPYAIILTGMVSMALLSRGSLAFSGLGAFLFLLSDSLLATDRFLATTWPAGDYVWVTYVGAQLLITLGFVLAPNDGARYGGYRFG